jgi:lipopolysaccharide assembly protein A
MQKAKLVGACVGALLIVIVILQNTQAVTTKLLFLTVTLPNALLIGLSVLVGLAGGIFLAMTFGHRHSSTKASTGSQTQSSGT